MSAAQKVKPQIEIKLSVQSGPHQGQRFTFTKGELTLGRGPENDLVLVNDPMLSRQQAVIKVVGHEVEVINLSQKNPILIGNQSVQKWKLVNDAEFTIGSSSFKIQFDLGSSVVAVAPKPIVRKTPMPQVATQGAGAAVVGAKPKVMTATSQTPLGTKPHLRPAQPFPPMYQVSAQNPQKKTFIYALAGAIILLSVYFSGVLDSKTNQRTPSSSAPTLKYEDDVAIKLNSKSEQELRARLESIQKQKSSPTALRADENFLRGMRDFNLGQYSRAMENFQVVLNLQPEHALARRYLYLSKVRFDEVLKAKLMLGENYYQSHNFKMCQSQFEQVMNMLIGQESSSQYKYAESMKSKCELAEQGIF